MLKSNRQYLLRAFRDWLCEQSKTPHLLIDVNYKGVVVPDRSAARNGVICFDVSEKMVRKFTLTNALLSFEAQLSGKVHVVKIPLAAIIYITCKELPKWSAWFNQFDSNDIVAAPEKPKIFKLD